MAFSNGFTSPRDDTQAPNFTSPIRTLSSQYVPQLPISSSERAGLTRRFTTNTVVPTLSSLQSPLSPIGQQRRQAAEQHDYGNHAHQRTQSHMQREHAERLKQSSLRARQEAERLEEEYRKYTKSGNQSEPTTPPDSQEGMLPTSTLAGRTNRFSLNGPVQFNNTSSLHRSTLSGSQHNFGYFGGGSGTQTPGNGQSISHRNSDEEDEDMYTNRLPSQNRRAAVRNSMPVTNFDYRDRGMGSNLPDVAQVLGIGSLLLDDDDMDYPLPNHKSGESMNRNSLLHMEHDENEFPTLLRRGQGDASNYQSMGNAAQRSEGNSAASGWPQYLRGHRQGQKSLPMNTLRTSEEESNSTSHSRNSSIYEPMRGKQNNRHSMDISLNTQLQSQQPQSNRSSTHMSPVSNTMPNLRSSLSTNDIPTINSFGMTEAPATGNMTHEQRIHNHNATLGRIPPNAVGHRREASIGTNRTFTSQNAAAPQGSNYMSGGMSASANAYAPVATTSGPPGIYTSNHMTSQRGLSAVPTGSIPSQMPYSMQHTAPPQNQWTNPTMMPYGAYNNQYFYQQGQHTQQHHQQQSQYGMSRGRDSQQWVMAQRRGQKQNEEADAMRNDNRFINTPIEEHIGHIFEVSKDQNGCRYLQKKIEEDKANNLPLIFGETKNHIVELMKDPFGNYLCQKLLEHCSAEQRTILINNAAPAMVDIAVNQHGTRALQKMIEHISGPEQTDVICRALGTQVVTLIQDLNGNHVIQKCLNHLRPDNAQFIFDAVGSNAYLVGTHRHGCCVLQRCIDHATGPQQEKLIAEITGNAFRLMQDAYGNYVIQYILDLNENKFTGPLCNTFTGHVVELSRQKFSSNVIEKSMRMAEANWQRQMVHELLVDPSQMEAILRDPYANYVIQTAIEHGPADIQARLWESIKPVMPIIRGTPVARRLSQKLTLREGHRSGHTSGSMTPQEGVHASANNGLNGYSSQYNPISPTNNSMAPQSHVAPLAQILHAPQYQPLPPMGILNGGPGPQLGHNIYVQNQVPGAHMQNQTQNRHGQYSQHPAGFF